MAPGLNFSSTRDAASGAAGITAKVAKIAVLMVCPVFILGCHQRTEESAKLAVDGPFTTVVDTDSLDDPTHDDSFADGDWSAATEWNVATVAKPVDFKLGDLVPCSDEEADFVLVISAMSGGNCYYRREQGFQRYDDRSVDPTGEAGMTEENLVCATLVSGWASGSFQYTDLGSDSVTVQIQWQASRGDQEEAFVGKFTPRVNESGSSAAGHGNFLSWSFLKKDQRDVATRSRS